MSAILHVNGWNVAEVNGEPTVKDTDLAERLGYSRPRDIRKLIIRMIDSQSFGGATPCRSFEKAGNGADVEVYHLNEKQALKVISKSETVVADKIMDEVIDVFLAVRNGKMQQLTPQAFTMKAIAEMANSYLGISNEVKTIKEDVEELRNTSTLDYAQQQKIQKNIAIRVAELRSNHNLTKETDRKLFQGLYRVLKEVFEVGSYKDIPKVQFSKAIHIIQNSTLKQAI